MSYELSEINRILAGLIRIGTVDELSGKKVRVKCGKNTTPLIPWLTEAADGDTNWRPPKKGAQVIVLSPGGDPAQGVVLRSIYQAQADAPASGPDVDHMRYADGTVVEYNRESHTMTTTLNEAGTINSTVGDSSLVMDKSSIKATVGSASLDMSKTSLKLSVGGISITLGPAGISIVGLVTQTGGDFISDGVSLQLHPHTGNLGQPTSPPLRA